MREDNIRFQSGELALEGLYHAGHSSKGAIITHPHPLYGGDMFNPVVEAIVAANIRCRHFSRRARLHLALTHNQ